MIKEANIYEYKGSPVVVVQFYLIIDVESKLINETKSRVGVSRDLINKRNPFFVSYKELNIYIEQ